jgi:HlyD family secretion protein
MKPAALAAAVLIAVAGAAAAWWMQSRPPAAPVWQGYIDADYVRVSPTLTGRLVSLSVSRGAHVAAGAPLFAQDDTDDVAARDAAAGRLAEAQARLDNLSSASRETEIAQAQADLNDATSTRDRIAKDLMRNEQLLRSGTASRQTVDQQRAELASAVAKANAARARLEQMQSPTGRQYEIAAQRAVMEQARAALAQAEWQVLQRHIAAPAAGLVADTFARPGETIAAGTPVVSLLPPQNILVRFFAPETALARLHVGQAVRIGCDGCAPGLTATIGFIAPQPEYTPPVIYSEDSRSKLVYLVEAHPPADTAERLKPGQPVSVRP